MTVGFVAFVRAVKRGGSCVPAFLIMIAAGFIKHNLIVLPLACSIQLAMTQPTRLVRLGALSLAVIAGGFALCREAYGPEFFANMLCERTIRVSRGLAALERLHPVAVGLLAWAYVGWKQRTDPDVRFCNILVVLGLASYFQQKCGEGVDCNAQFELVFGVAIAAGLVISRMASLPIAATRSPERLTFGFLLALLLPLACLTHREPIRLVCDSSFREEIAARQAAMADTVARVRNTPGDVYCSAYTCHRAGKPFIVDDFNLSQRVRAGSVAPDALQELLLQRKLTIVLEAPLAQ